MCILIIKNKKLAIPSRETLATCFENNPDGAGFCYNKNGNIVIKKGFMDFDSFYKEAQKIPNESSALLHFRIGTSGGKTPAMTHPYPLTNNFDEMKKTSQILKGSGGRKFAVAHNGIFNGLGYRQDINDTCLFIANILTPLNDSVDDIQDSTLEPVINRLVDNSRLAILDNYGNVTKYGSGWIEDSGIWYSNGTYKKYEVKTTYYGYGGYDRYDDYYYDDLLDNYEYDKVNKRWVEKKPAKQKKFIDWFGLASKKYGSYKEYLAKKAKDERVDIDLLKEAFPDKANDIEDYYLDGFTCWQIRNWLEQDML